MEKKHATLLFLLVLWTLAAATLIASTDAEENPVIWIYNEDGDVSDSFNIGDKVGIKACSATTPYDIYVYDPDGDERYHWQTGLEDWDSGLLTDISDELGWWEVKAGTTETHFATGYYQVIPEVLFGTLAAVGACFAGLGIIRIRRK